MMWNNNMTFHSVQFKLRLHAGELKEKYFLYIMPNTGLYFHTYLICDSKKKHLHVQCLQPLISGPCGGPLSNLATMSFLNVYARWELEPEVKKNSYTILSNNPRQVGQSIWSKKANGGHRAFRKDKLSMYIYRSGCSPMMASLQFFIRLCQPLKR